MSSIVFWLLPPLDEPQPATATARPTTASPATIVLSLLCIGSSWGEWPRARGRPDAASGSLAQPVAELIEADRGHQHGADSHVLPVLVETDDGQPGQQHR